MGWNVVGIVVLTIAAVSARSVALAGFAMDSLIEIGGAFGLLAVYLLVQSTFVLMAGYHPQHSVPGIIWTGATALVKFALAAGKARAGAALGNQVLATEGRVTLVDAVWAVAVLIGLTLNAALGWWWADPVAGYVLVFYTSREVRDIFGSHQHGLAPPSTS